MKKILMLVVALTAVGPVEAEAQIIEQVKCGLLGLVGSECARTPRNLEDLVQQGDVYLDRQTMRPYTGPFFEFFPDDDSKVRSRGSFKDGRMHGVNEEYSRDGYVEVRLNMTNGEVDGLQEIFNQYGLELAFTVKDGERGPPPDGRYEWYYDDGMLNSRGTLVNGKTHGPGAYHLRGLAGVEVYRGSYNMGTKCGQWSENGRIRNYDPC